MTAVSDALMDAMIAAADDGDEEAAFLFGTLLAEREGIPYLRAGEAEPRDPDGWAS